MYKVSIIIPVYNAEDYISKCIDSVLSQDYKNIELILLNDGSTDKSLEILKMYYNKYPEIIRVIDQKNMGVSNTRNKAIDLATGAYIMFIDNDDYIDSNYISSYISALNEDYDMVLGGYRRTNSVGKVLVEKKLTTDSWSKFTIVAPWAKLYKKSYLMENDFKFLNSNIGEDIYFNIPAVIRSKKIKVIDYIGYNWFYNENSISNTLHKSATKELQFDLLLDSLFQKLKYDEKKNEEIEYFFIKTIVWYLLYSCKQTQRDVFIHNYNEVFSWLNMNIPNYKNNKLLSFSKPKGEEFKNRFITKIFMLLHSLRCAKMFLLIFRRI